MEKMTEISNQIAGQKEAVAESLTPRLWPSAATFTCLSNMEAQWAGFGACQSMPNTGNPSDVALPAWAWVISRAESQEELTRFRRKWRELEFCLSFPVNDVVGHHAVLFRHRRASSPEAHTQHGPVLSRVAAVLGGGSGLRSSRCW